MASRFQFSATFLPFFVPGWSNVNGLTLPSLLHYLLNSFYCDVWIHFPRQIQSSFLPKMVHIMQVFQVFYDSAHRSSVFLLMLLYNQGMIFYINHFSLIIFYHSVWLGFELFGLRVQVHSHWVQFYARAQRI